MKEEICLVNIPEKNTGLKLGDVVHMDIPVLLNAFFFCSRGVVISKTNPSSGTADVVGHESNEQKSIPLTQLYVLPTTKFSNSRHGVIKHDITDKHG